MRCPRLGCAFRRWKQGVWCVLIMACASEREEEPATTSTTAPLPRAVTTPDAMSGSKQTRLPTASLALSASVPDATRRSPRVSGLSNLDPERVLVATARRTFIVDEPRPGARRLGYLKAGSVVARQAEPAAMQGCSQGFYGIEPDGYVCVGKHASLDMDHPLVAATTPGPARDQPLPYTYALSRYPTPPFYTRVPTTAEQRRTEEELHYHLPRRTMDEWLELPIGETPAFLLGGRPSFHSNGVRKSPSVVADGRALVQSGFGLLSLFRADGRHYGLSTDYDVLPLDRMDVVKLSSFRGVELGTEYELPLAFVRAKHARIYRRTSDHAFVPGRIIQYREAFSLTGNELAFAGKTFLETKDGTWIRRTSRVVEVGEPRRWPRWATPGRTWLDISILKQTLVAYEGTKARYATLVSTGADGLRDPNTSKATIQGQFLTHTKHLTASMSGSDEGGAFDLREVPHVQYFSGGYALHAAYWHDSFGLPRSHGCVNLSPLDAQWLFQWTEPPLPPGWHGVMSLLDGTLVHIHP